MAGKVSTSDTTSTTGTTSTTSGSGGVAPPGPPPPQSIVLIPPPSGAPGALGAAADGEDETVRSLSHMGKRAPKLYDPKREQNFDAWLDRVVFHMSVSKIPDEKRTSSLLLLFDTDSFEAARHLGIQYNTDFDIAKEKLKAYFAITETPEEIKEKLALRRQEAGETIESFARDIKLIGHKAHTGKDPELLKDIMIYVFIRGLRDEQSRKRTALITQDTD